MRQSGTGTWVTSSSRQSCQLARDKISRSGVLGDRPVQGSSGHCDITRLVEKDDGSDPAVRMFQLVERLLIPDEGIAALRQRAELSNHHRLVEPRHRRIGLVENLVKT